MSAIAVRPQRPVAVSLTPVSLDADSRAYRAATSLSEYGFHSIVVEAQPSGERDWGAEIELRSPSGAPAGPHIVRGSLVGSAVSAMRSGVLGAAGEFALYLGYRLHDWHRHLWGLRALLPAADLYYLHSFELYRVVAKLSAHRGARIIYDAHDFYRGIEPREQLRPFDRHRLRPYLDHLENQLVARADAVVTVSDGVARLMEGQFGRRPTVIRNCHDAGRDRPPPHDLRRLLTVSAADSLAVVVGNAKSGMAIRKAADALALLGERFHLAFIGRGYDTIAASLSGHPAAARIHFVGGFAPNRVVPLIAAADLGLVIYEPCSENYVAALPNGFFQLLAAGLPVVRGALPQIEGVIAGRAVGISLPKLSATALADAIRTCIGERAMFRRAVKGLARFLSWEAEAPRLHRVLDNLFDRAAAD